MTKSMAGVSAGSEVERAAEGGQGCFRSSARLVLASGSPRRQEFLRGLGLEFEIRPADVVEEPVPGEEPRRFVERLALDKAQAVAALDPAAHILAADTIVVLAGELLGKPRHEEEAISMLMRLGGRTHEVWTGFALCRGAELLSRQAVRTEVIFAPLSEELCRAYVRTGEPLDKAGAYGIQGQGGFLVERIRGSYSNVVGLPLAEVVSVLLACGVIAPRV
jgi:septum formation protein